VPNRTGDLIVTLNLTVPKTLTDTQKDILRQFAAETGEDTDNLEGKKGIFGKRKK
jgi:molecular chaperone DnaJ